MKINPFTIYVAEADQEFIPDEKDIFMAEIDCERCRSEERFHDEIAAALKFPDYYGRNLDALFDNLIDLCWINHNNIVIRFRNIDSLMADEPQKSYLIEGLILLLADLCLSEQNDDPESTFRKNVFIAIDNHSIISKKLKSMDVPYLVLN